MLIHGFALSLSAANTLMPQVAQMPSLSDERLRRGAETTIFCVMPAHSAAAPTPTLPRKRGRESAAASVTPSPACGGGSGWGLPALEPSKIVDRVLYRDGLVLVID